MAEDDNNEDDGDPSLTHERLGKSALGRHAFESQMPTSLRELLDNETSSNDLPNIIPALTSLLALDTDLASVTLCHPAAVQVCKIAGEGHHFCGYRNIQMLLLALGGMGRLSSRKESAPESREVGQAQSAKVALCERKLRIPELQDAIEAAWDAGINAHARAQTGGIRGTRKDIGTSEAEALLLHHNIPCTGHVFTGQDACARMFDLVEEYFSSTSSSTNATSIMQTQASTSESEINLSNRPPLFLQRPGHSITVVGIERAKNGKRRLLTFDPAYAPSGVVRKAAAAASAAAAVPAEVKEGAATQGSNVTNTLQQQSGPSGETAEINGKAKQGQTASWRAKMALWRYRKSEKALGRWKAFEVLVVDDPASAVDAGKEARVGVK